MEDQQPEEAGAWSQREEAPSENPIVQLLYLQFLRRPHKIWLAKLYSEGAVLVGREQSLEM